MFFLASLGLTHFRRANVKWGSNSRRATEIHDSLRRIAQGMSWWWEYLLMKQSISSSIWSLPDCHILWPPPSWISLTTTDMKMSTVRWLTPGWFSLVSEGNKRASWEMTSSFGPGRFFHLYWKRLRMARRTLGHGHWWLFLKPFLNPLEFFSCNDATIFCWHCMLLRCLLRDLKHQLRKSWSILSEVAGRRPQMKAWRSSTSFGTSPMHGSQNKILEQTPEHAEHIHCIVSHRPFETPVLRIWTVENWLRARSGTWTEENTYSD